MRTIIWIRTEVQGFHRWVDAPDDVKFLRNWHRHVFHVKLGMDVPHLNRAIEFFQLKRNVDLYLREKYEEKQFEDSCEQIALDLLTHFEAAQVEVSEDGENGAFVESYPLTKVEWATDSKLTVESTPQYVRQYGVRKLCFKGIEAEGPHHGKRVLFVPGSVDTARMSNVLSRYGQGGCFNRIYYGAGNDRNISKQMVEYLCGRFPPESVDVECLHIPEWLVEHRKNGVTVILYHDKPPASNYVHLTAAPTYHKWIENDQVVWRAVPEERSPLPSSRNWLFHTRLDDPLFDNDSFVEEEPK